jgi:hypothetical protein
MGWKKVGIALIVGGMDKIEDNIPAGWLASLAQSKAEVEARSCLWSRFLTSCGRVSRG